MKLPFDFATKFILRLILPGALFAALLWPLAAAALKALGVAATPAIVIPVMILVTGWLTLLLDMPIYMLFEGRRFWPKPLRAWLVKREAARLKRLIDGRAAAKKRNDGARASELALDSLDFPLSETGEPYAAYPTRLGNLLTAIETYPDSKYGIDGVWGWSRLWVAVDKDLRGEMDDQQAVADSGLYAAFVFSCAFPILLAYALAAWLWPGVLLGLPPFRLLLALAAAALFLVWFLYRLSLAPQRQYGELFKALFDQHHAKLEVKEVVDALAAHNGEARRRFSDRERYRAGIRFLRWHRYRLKGAPTNEIVRDW
ncbi:MAG: hypothetical protein QOJ27_2319 [Sphingomonadales bacterium]|nr:hypothetical protein [Sphingomonadales bacterium]